MCTLAPWNRRSVDRPSTDRRSTVGSGFLTDGQPTVDRQSVGRMTVGRRSADSRPMVPLYFWVGVCRPLLRTLTLFQTKIYDLAYPISDLNPKMYTLFQTCPRLWCGGFFFIFWRFPPDVFPFALLCDVHGDTLPLKSYLRTRQTEYIPYFRPKRQTRNAWKWYPLGRHIPFWLIYGSTPPPPPAPPGLL